MNTFLPAGYRFSSNEVLNPHDFTIPPMNHVIFGMFVVIMITTFLWSITELYDNINIKRGSSQHKIYVIIKLLLLMTLFGCVFYIVKADHDPYRQYQTKLFKCADKGNLIITMLDKGSKPTKINDHKPYPYELYYNSDNEYIYLGTMKNGKFTPSTDGRLAPTFYKYYQYIQQHKLADKFKHDATLKRDGRYQTHNGKAQWVLTNNKDMTLHFADNTDIEHSHVVEN